MRQGVFAFATDFADEGLATAFDRLGEWCGTAEVAYAAAYHHGRDVLPHNPVRKVRFLEGGAVFFTPDPRRWTGVAHVPPVGEAARDRDLLGEVCRAAAERGGRASAWTVFLHNSRVGAAAPELTCRNAYGDPYLTDLCPSNPATVAYARALAGDVARHPIDAVLGESLHFAGLEHGYHHERYFVELRPATRVLLGLCFCRHCLERAGGAVDGERLAAAVRAHVDAALDGEDPAPVDGDALADLAVLVGDDIAAYCDARCRTVADLVAAVGEEVRAQGRRLVFMDGIGAAKGYGDGRPTGPLAVDEGWRFGVGLDRLAPAVDGVLACAYVADVVRLSEEVAGYREALGELPLLAALRPGPPDALGVDDLVAKLDVLEDHGVEAAMWYAYGLLPRTLLARIGEVAARRG